MNRKTFSVCVLLTLPWVAEARAAGEQAGEPELTTAYKKALSQLPGHFPNALEVRDAAKAFTDMHGDATAMAFLKKTALDDSEAVAGRPGQMAAFIGLALLSKKHDTASFLKSQIGNKQPERSNYALLAISFLPTEDARLIAEGVVTDGNQDWHTRNRVPYLLGSLGDQQTLEKLEKMKRTNESPYFLEVRDRTASFIKQRLSLDQPAERDRWARQELLFLRINCSTPNFRSVKTALPWAAKQIHRNDEDISIELLKAKLSGKLPSDAAGYSIAFDVPLAAVVAGLQKNRELLPLLEKWGATDFGYISDTCREVAKQLRDQDKR
jgi:hypothetical protein